MDSTTMQAAPETTLSSPAQKATERPGSTAHSRTRRPQRESSNVGVASSPMCQAKLLAGNPGNAPRLIVAR